MLLSLAPSPSGRPWCKAMLPGGYVTFPIGKLACKPGCLSSWGAGGADRGRGDGQGSEGVQGADRGQTGCGGKTGDRGCRARQGSERVRGTDRGREGVRDRQGSGCLEGQTEVRGVRVGGCWQPAQLGAVPLTGPVGVKDVPLSHWPPGSNVLTSPTGTQASWSPWAPPEAWLPCVSRKLV